MGKKNHHEKPAESENELQARLTEAATYATSRFQHLDGIHRTLQAALMKPMSGYTLALFDAEKKCVYSFKNPRTWTERAVNHFKNLKEDARKEMLEACTALTRRHANAEQNPPEDVTSDSGAMPAE